MKKNHGTWGMFLDDLKTKRMCERAVEKEPDFLEDVPDWFVTQEQIKLRDDRLIKWYNGYRKRKAQKAKMKEELLPIAWHPSRY